MVRGRLDVGRVLCLFKYRVVAEAFALGLLAILANGMCFVTLEGACS